MNPAIFALILRFNGLASFPMPDHCVPTFCESWAEMNGSLVCYDTDDVFPPDHWAYDIGPDQGDLQVTVEY